MWVFPWFWKQVFSRILIWSFARISASKSCLNVNILPSEKPLEKKQGMISLLDLPELPLECILEKLSPSELYGMTNVCTYLKERCKSNHLWEKHMKQKWGKLIGDAATQKWKKQQHIASRTESQVQKGFWQCFCRENTTSIGNQMRRRCLTNTDCLMGFYLAIETGKFWFPARIFNREEGVGFMMSCYEAEVSYDSTTDTFVARYKGNGGRTIEDNIGWNNVRAPRNDTHGIENVLYVSDCLNDLKPGDQIEVQWRRSKDFPHGWWYAVVGHLSSCNGIESQCLCYTSDILMLEFKQYMIGSRWRQAQIKRKDHKEEGDGSVGFYGGIRKLCNEEEISMWMSFWPPNTLKY